MTKRHGALALLLTAAAALVHGCGGSAQQDGVTIEPCVPGKIRTIAGNRENGYSGNDGYARQARLSLPQDTLTAADGTIYIIDWNNHRIRKVTTDGIIRHVVGRGELGGTSDDHAGVTNTDFNHPTAILFDPTATFLYVAAWHNSKIRKILLATAEVVDLVGDGRRNYFGDGAAALTSTLDLPTSVAVDPDGNLVIMDQANQVIRWVDGSGVIRRLAGQCIIDDPAPGGPGACATPTACPGSSGKLTCGDPATTCTQACSQSYAGDGGPALAMRMAQPIGQSAFPGGRMAYDSAGNLYFADTSNSLIRKIDTSGNVHLVAGTAPIGTTKQNGYSGDGGPALGAKLNGPVDLSFADDGTLYFTDLYNHCVRKIAVDGTISTVAGQCGVAGDAGDGGDPTDALLTLPFGVEWTAKGLNITDTGNSAVRQICFQ